MELTLKLPSSTRTSKLALGKELGSGAFSTAYAAKNPTWVILVTVEDTDKPDFDWSKRWMSELKAKSLHFPHLTFLGHETEHGNAVYRMPWYETLDAYKHPAAYAQAEVMRDVIGRGWITKVDSVNFAQRFLECDKLDDSLKLALARLTFHMMSKSPKGFYFDIPDRNLSVGKRNNLILRDAVVSL